MIDDDKIRERAYALWEQQGRPEEATEDFWHEARRQLEAEAGASDEGGLQGEGDEAAPIVPGSQG